MRMYMRAKRKQRRESGMCIECGSRKAVKSPKNARRKHVLCRVCIERGNSRWVPTGNKEKKGVIPDGQ